MVLYTSLEALFRCTSQAAVHWVGQGMTGAPSVTVDEDHINISADAWTPVLDF